MLNLVYAPFYYIILYWICNNLGTVSASSVPHALLDRQEGPWLDAPAVGADALRRSPCCLFAALWRARADRARAACH